MNVRAIRTRIFREGENLDVFITRYVPRLKDGSILVVTSKIVALAEGRTAVVKDKKAKEKLIRAESEFALPTKWVWLTIKDGAVMSNAGIDESNANGKLILLPKDSFRAAAALRKKLKRIYKIRRLGVVITDSRVTPLRAGVVGVALGYAGFRGVRDYRGKPDIFGRTLKITQTNIADSIATSAVITMGEGNERRPLAVIEDAPIIFCEKVNQKELHIAIEDDIYGPLFARRR